MQHPGTVTPGVQVCGIAFKFFKFVYLGGRAERKGDRESGSRLHTVNVEPVAELQLLNGETMT